MAVAGLPQKISTKHNPLLWCSFESLKWVKKITLKSFYPFGIFFLLRRPACLAKKTKHINVNLFLFKIRLPSLYLEHITPTQTS
jgi:hypothetical protein